MFFECQYICILSVVYHWGKSATDGHYTTAVRRSDGRWMHIDDTTVLPLNESELFKVNSDRSEYLLFYQRCE